MEKFYNSLKNTLDSVPNRDVKIIMGDFNAKVGKLKNSKPNCGKFGLGDQNERGADLLEFCQSNNLIIHFLNIILIIFIHEPFRIGKHGTKLII